MNFIPARDVISELERLAASYDKAAQQTREPEAGKLRQFAQLCRCWIMSLKYGSWTS